MIYFIIGASGSGKSSCCKYLKTLLSNYTIYDFDDIVVPSNPDKKWRQEATEKWIKQLTANNDSSNFCLVGQMVTGEILAAPSAQHLTNINIYFLDCSDWVRIQRLKIRGTHGVNQVTLSWSAMPYQFLYFREAL